MSVDTQRIQEILGDVSNDNTYDSSTVVANRDGSLLEREEAIQVSVGEQADSAVQGSGNASLQGGNKGLRASIGDPSGDTLASLNAKFGNLTVSLVSKFEPTATSASFTFTADTTIEQVIFTISPAATQFFEVDQVYLDLNALMQNATIKIQVRVDGTNWRTVTNSGYTAGGVDKGSSFGAKFIVDNTAQLRVAIVSDLDEGVNRSIPYRYFSRRVV